VGGLSRRPAQSPFAFVFHRFAPLDGRAAHGLRAGTIALAEPFVSPPNRAREPQVTCRRRLRARGRTQEVLRGSKHVLAGLDQRKTHRK
jgi:hypothetical protein